MLPTFGSREAYKSQRKCRREIVGFSCLVSMGEMDNAGSNTLAQALWDYRKDHSQAEVDQFVSRLRVFENGAQDNAGAWICANFPKIHWIRSNYQTYCYGGPSGDIRAHLFELEDTGESLTIKREIPLLDGNN